MAFEGSYALWQIFIGSNVSCVPISLRSILAFRSKSSCQNCPNTTIPLPMEKQKDKKKRAVIYQPLAEGGLNFINFGTMVKSLRLAWIGRILGDTDDSWKVIPNSYLSAYGGLQFPLKYNYNAESINKGLPNFYRELLQYFQELKKHDQYISLRRVLTVEQ